MQKRSRGSVFLWSKQSLGQLGLVLFAASWLSAEHFAPWLSFHSELIAFIAVALLVCAGFFVPAVNIYVPVISVAILFVAIIPWLQWVTGLSLYSGDAVLSTLYLAGFSFAVWVGFSFQKIFAVEDRACKPLMLAILVPALLSAGIAWFQWLSVDELLGALLVPSQPGRAIGNLAQPNNLATLLLMGLIACAYLYKKQVIGSIAFAFSSIFMSIALTMTQSRTGLLSAMVVAVFWGFKRGALAPRLSLFLLMLWVTMIFAIMRILPAVSDTLLLTSGAIPRSISDSSGRWEIWQQVLTAISQSPWWGYGWNQTFAAQTVGALAHPGELSYTYAHNLVLDLLTWNGIPLGLLVISAGVYWSVSRTVYIKSAEGIFAMMVLLPIAVHSLLEFPFAYAFFLFSTGYFVGVVEGTLNGAVTWKIGRAGKAGAGFIFSVWLAVCIWVAYEYIKIEEDYRIVRFENLRIGSTPAMYIAPGIVVLTQMGGMLQATRIKVEPGMSAEHVEQLRKASLRFPYGLLTYKYALALALNNDAVGASQQMAVLRGVFGAQYYKESKAAFRRLEAEKYPQLSYVITP